MHGISSWSIRHPIPTVVLFLVLSLAGAACFALLPINATPNVDIPTVTVTVAQRGAAPAELETEVTRRVEAAVAGVSNVRHVLSTITSGTSVTTVEFRLGVPSDRAATDVRDAVTRIRQDLPRTIEEPLVARVDAAGGAIATYAVEFPGMAPEELAWFVDDTVARALRGVPGVASVPRLGGVDREVRIDLDPVRLEALGITALEVNAQLRALNANPPGGRTEAGGRAQAIRAIGSAPSVEALADSAIALPDGRWARLGDLGEVRDGAAEPRQVALLDGKPAVAFQIQRSQGASEVAVAEAVEHRVAELMREHPGLRATRVSTTVSDTLESYHASLEELLVGAVLATLVVFAFLRDWRATLIAAVALPLSVLPTFAAMQLLGFSLNQVSLLALTLSIGVLVDDAIVEVENIHRHIGEGKRPYRASLEAADEIGLAVVATTATIVAVFLPVSAMGGVAGQYFRQFGVTVAVAVMASLLVARMLTPLMAAYFLAPHVAAPGAEGRLMRGYCGLLGWTLRHRAAALGIAAAILAASVSLATHLKTSFVPQSDGTQVTMSVELPPGTAAARAEAAAVRINKALRGVHEVASVFVDFGSAQEAAFGAASGGDISRGTVTIGLVPAHDRERTRRELVETFRPLLAALPDMRFGATTSGARELSVLLVGDDAAALGRAAEEVVAGMRALPGLFSVVSTAPLPSPELLVRPRLDEASRLGVSVEDIAATVLVATQGDLEANLARFASGDRRIPIRVRLPDAARDDPSTLELLRVRAAGGAAVPLTSVADLEWGVGEARIERRDRRRRIALQADLAPGVTLGEALAAVEALPAMRSLPPGVQRQDEGDAEMMGEMFGQFGGAMAAGVLLIYAVLVLLFRDFLQPVTILAALPLSMGGAFGALLLTGRPIDLTAFIGLLMLMGIVTKNSILLVEYALERERAGMPRMDALLEAGATRARPIVMTTVAMVAGMMLPAFGVGAGAGFRSSMAVVVIGGLVASTALSLVFVPVVYAVMAAADERLGRVLRRLTTVDAGDLDERGAGPVGGTGGSGQRERGTP